MKSSGYPHMGQLKMRGKIDGSAPCGCCNVPNFKWRERLREADKEISDTNAPWELDLLAAEGAYFAESIPWANQPARRWEFAAQG